MYAARRTGLKKEMFGYVRGGYARVLRRFAEALEGQGVELRTSSRVREATSTADGSVRLSTDSGVEHFDRIVFTVPSPVIAAVCPQLVDDERRRHQSIRYLGIVCASVLLKRPRAEYYVTNITDPGLPFTAVIEMTALVDRAELAGNHLVYLPRYVASGDDAWQWSDDEVRERFLDALERMYPSFTSADVTAFRVSRAPHVMALPTREYSEHLPPMVTAAANIFAVNSAHIVKGTLNVNEVIDLAETAFEKVLLPACNAELTHHKPGEHIAGPERSFHVEAARELVARSR
jgi:protoporphyrinogen oxidase